VQTLKKDTFFKCTCLCLRTLSNKVYFEGLCVWLYGW